MSRTIVQDITMPAKPSEVFQALNNPSRFSQLTGGKKAEIGSEAGSRFSLFDGMITGLLVEAIPNQRLVQVWRAGNWPDGVYSLVSFNFQANDDGTAIHFEQHGHPADAQEHLEAGWHKMYWQPLTAYLTG